MKPTILDAAQDPQLFGPDFGEPSWAPWHVALAALFGLELPEGGLELYRECSGRERPPAEPAREGWLIVGRRGGKSRIAALVAVFLACFRDYTALLAPGERGVVMLIASDRRQCRVLLGYIRALLHEVAMLARLVESETREAIHLANGISLEVHTASFRSTRGYTIASAVLDETAFWRSEDAAEPDHEVVNALKPGMATVPGALLLGISSPYSRRGVLWDAFREHHGREDSDVFLWKAPSLTMNPQIPASVVERAYAEDPAAASAEYLAEFRTDVESFMAREAVEAVVVPERRELPPVAGVTYRASVDPSGGSADSMTLAVAHAEEKGDARRVVLDCVREMRPPFSPDAVAEEFSDLLRSYGVREVRGDHYSAEWVVERFRAHGVRYEASSKSKSELYRELLPAINAGRVELLDHPRLVAQLVGLERRTTRGGRESIDHAPAGRDDVSNAVAGVIAGLAVDRGKSFAAYEIVGVGLRPIL